MPPSSSGAGFAAVELTTNASETTAAARSTERRCRPARAQQLTGGAGATGIVFGTASAAYIHPILAGFLPPDDYGFLALVIAIVGSRPIASACGGVALRRAGYRLTHQLHAAVHRHLEHLRHAHRL